MPTLIFLFTKAFYAHLWDYGIGSFNGYTDVLTTRKKTVASLKLFYGNKKFAA